MSYKAKDGSEPSPEPWKVVHYHIPFYNWIADATGGTVCLGFGSSDENLLVSAPRLRSVCAKLAAYDGGPLEELVNEARTVLAACEKG